MNINKRLRFHIEKNIKRLSIVAGVLLALGIFILITQNIMLSWFMDREALTVIARSYSTSFKMAYTPFTHLAKAEQILSSTLESSTNEQIVLNIFKDSHYFTDVAFIDDIQEESPLKEGEVIWRGIELVNNEPQLLLYYKVNSSVTPQLLSLQLPLSGVNVENPNIEGYSIIRDDKGNIVTAVLNESQWHTYNTDMQEKNYAESIQINPVMPRNFLENPLRRNIENEEYGFTSIEFDLDGTQYTIDFFINENSINGNGQLILASLIIVFSFFGFVLFIVIIFGRPEKLRITDEEKIKKILLQGESENTEFKSSLRWDYKNTCVNKDLEKVIIKSIAAFSNAKGGKILIGVQDDGSLLGLDNDYSTLKNQNADFFELHLRNIVDKEFGQDFCASQIQCSFYSIKNPEGSIKEIAIITIKASDEPVYLNLENKGEVFYVRSGNSSRKIENLSDLMRYVKKRF